MILNMARPWKHPKTGVFYYRQRPPARALERMKGERLSLSVSGARVDIRVRDIVAVSLRTKEADEAKRRFRDVSKQVERHYNFASDTAVTLSHEETIHLAGEWRRSLIAEFRANPGDAEGWEVDVEFH